MNKTLRLCQTAVKRAPGPWAWFPKLFPNPLVTHLIQTDLLVGLDGAPAENADIGVAKALQQITSIRKLAGTIEMAGND